MIKERPVVRETVLYFAYGSNMHPGRIHERVGSSRFVCTAILPGFRLAFHKRGQDGSAKCDAWPSSDGSDAVYGVVYALSKTDKHHLDTLEGVGHGYDCTEQSVRAWNESMVVNLYTAQAAYIDDSLRPFDWYRQLVIEGARQHKLPPAYIRGICSICTITDPDQSRAHHYWRLLATAGQ